MTQYTAEMGLEYITGASRPDEAFDRNMDEIDKGGAYGMDLAVDGNAGEWFRMDGSGEAVKAQADTEANSLVMGILTLDGAAGADRSFRYDGCIEITGWGLTPLTQYYLSPSVAGGMTTTKPSGTDRVVELGESDSTGDKFYIRIRIYSAGVAVHSLLGSSHTDVTAAAVQRGDIITGQGASPTWARLAKGSEEDILVMGANEPAWASSINADHVAIPGGYGTPTYDDMQDFLQMTRSAGRMTGGVVSATTPADGTVKVSAMEGYVFATNALGAVYIPFKMAEATGISLTDLSVNWIYFDYNGGAPRYLATTTRADINEYNQFAVGRVWREGTTVEVLATGHSVYDKDRRSHNRLILKYGCMDRSSGGDLTAHATPLRLSVSAGAWYVANTPYTTDAQDKFHVIYKTGGGAWTESAELTLFSEVFDGGTSKVYETYQNGTSLAALTANHYGVYWVFLCPVGDVHIVLGTASYANIGLAQAASVPASLPARCLNWSRLIGRIICRKTAAAFYSVESVWATSFTLSAATDHASLANLPWADAGHTINASLIGTADNTYDLGSAAYQYRTAYIGTSILMKDGATIGQAAGPLVTFDDTNNYLEITGCKVGVGIATPSYLIEAYGTAAADGMRSHMGYDIYKVPDPTTLTGAVSGGGSVDTGDHYYGVSFVTAAGESHVKYSAKITTTAGNNTVTLTIPVSTDPRVTGRKIYRTIAASPYIWTDYFLATVANNSDVSYVDTAADASISGGASPAGYARRNTTSYNITINAVQSLEIDTAGTHVGVSSGASLTTGGYNVFLGANAGKLATAATTCVAVGSDACAAAAMTGSYNVAVGAGAGYSLLSAGYDTLIGTYAGYYIASGASTVCIGHDAGRWTNGRAGSNLAATQCIYIGREASAYASGRTNEIVIGYLGQGLGSNSTVLGNSSTTVTRLFGALGLGVDAPAARIHALTTTEQLRLGYDASNYLSATIGSTGSATLALTGTSPEFTFSQQVNLTTLHGTNIYADHFYEHAAAHGCYFGSNVGIGAVSTEASLYVLKYADLSSTMYTAFFYFITTNAGTVAGPTGTGYYLRHDGAGAHTGNTCAFACTVDSNSAGTIGNAVAGRFQYINSKTGVTTVAKILHINGVSFLSSGTCGTMNGIYIENQGHANVTDVRGIYIANQTGATNTNWGLWNAGTTNLVGQTDFVTAHGTNVYADHLYEHTGSHTIVVGSTIDMNSNYFNNVAYIGMGCAANGQRHITMENAALSFAGTSKCSYYLDWVKTAGASDANSMFDGVRIGLTYNQTGATIGNMRAMQFVATLTDGGVGDVSNARDIYGVTGVIDLDGGKVWGNVKAQSLVVDQEAANEITGDVYGQIINIDCDGTVSGTVYGIYMYDQSGVDYAMYQVGAAPWSFGGVIASRLAIGTAPFTIASTTVCTNLNADLLDGNHAAAFALAAHGHDGGTP